MKDRSKKLNMRMIYTTVGVGGMSSVFYNFWEATSAAIKFVLCTPFLHVIVWVLVLFLYVTHYFKIRQKEEKIPPVLSKSLPPILDNCFGAFTYIAIISTSLTLIKGLFLQGVYGEEYFKDFGAIDIAGLVVVLFILLWYSINNIIEDVNELYWIDNSRDIEIKEKPATNKA